MNAGQLEEPGQLYLFCFCVSVLCLLYSFVFVSVSLCIVLCFVCTVFGYCVLCVLFVFVPGGANLGLGCMGTAHLLVLAVARSKRGACYVFVFCNLNILYT